MKLRTLLVDDERSGLENLELSLKTYCPEIDQIETATSSTEGELALLNSKFDLLFLDIHMPKTNGFHLLKRLEGTKHLPPCILVSAHHNFGLDAIKAGVIDYITKPIDALDLCKAVDRVIKRLQIENSLEANKRDHPTELSRRISIPHQTGFELFEVGHISRLQADGSYTLVIRKDAPSLIVPKTLKDFEKILPDAFFVRVHHSHMVNLHYVKSFSNEDGGTILMRNGDSVIVSRRKQQYFQQQVKNYSTFLS